MPEIARLIDHTLLKPEATESDIATLCQEARQYCFASVCVNPHWASFAAARLTGTPVRVCTVIGFPLGANSTDTKLFEADLALKQGAMELDMVINIGALKGGQHGLVFEEIAKLSELAHANSALLKVIIETALLSDGEKVQACELARQAKADFVKTSTGFSRGGATVADVQLMRRTVGNEMGVKASGGVRTLEAVREMVAAGATRLGTSSGVAIMRELESGSPSATTAATAEVNPY